MTHIDCRAKPTVNQLTIALLADHDDCWKQVRQMPEPSLLAMQWAQILTTAARRQATTPTVRIVPVASCQNAAVIHDQQRFIVSTQFLQNQHVK